MKTRVQAVTNEPLSWYGDGVEIYLEKNKTMSRKSGTRLASAPSTKRLTKSKPRLYLNANSTIDYKEQDEWSDDFAPESPPPLPLTSFDDPFGGVSITKEEFRNGQLGARSLSVRSLKTYSSKRNTISSPSPAPKVTEPENFGLSSRNTSTSTLFHDPEGGVPITIVLTTPEDEIPQPTWRVEDIRRSRTSSVTSLPTLPSQRPAQNPSFLMPPTDNTLDPRKLREAQEFREVRKWLISFMNTKPESFPKKLRGRMCGIYKIKESDLSPVVVARWKGEEDEGVVLDAEGGRPVEEGEMDQEESLRMLGLAMRQNIEAQVPMRRPDPMATRNKTWPPAVPKSNIEGPPPALPTKRERPPSRKTSPPRTSSNALCTIPDDDESAFNLDIPTWLGPLISTSTSSRDSLLSNDKYLKKAYSTPNLQDKPRPTLPSSTVSSESVPTLGGGSGSLYGDEKKWARRSWFDDLREKIGGRSAGIRALEKGRGRRR